MKIPEPTTLLKVTKLTDEITVSTVKIHNPIETIGRLLEYIQELSPNPDAEQNDRIKQKLAKVGKAGSFQGYYETMVFGGKLGGTQMRADDEKCALADHDFCIIRVCREENLPMPT